MIPSLQWVTEFHASFNRAADLSSSLSVEDTVNPLIKHVVFHLSEPLSGDNYAPFQKLAHAFARANNCVLERIYNQPDRLVLVVGIGRRLGPAKNNNPLLGDKSRSTRRG